MADPNLELDTSILEDQGKVYSSLTDINGIPLFTSGFREKAKQVGEEAETGEREVQARIFTGSLLDTGREESLKDQLFQGTAQRVVKEEESGQSEGLSLYPFLGGAFLLFFVLLLWYCRRRERKTREKALRMEEEPFV